MACTSCGLDGHNVRSCPRVRRCGVCNGRGHDRRNCPELSSQTQGGATFASASMERLGQMCRGRDALLAHLYWRDKVGFFSDNLRSYRNGGGWEFVATEGHGVHQPSRMTLNFFVADTEFISGYAGAATSRGLTHGVLIQRSAIEGMGRVSGYDFAQIRVGYPRSYGETEPSEYWRFDLGNHRFTSVATLQYATVVRLATPDHWRRRRIRVSQDAIVAWWCIPSCGDALHT